MGIDALLLQILGNTPTLAAVLALFYHYKARCDLLEYKINELKERGLQ